MNIAHTRLHPDWLAAIRRYLIAATTLHLVWEVAQLPLYTLWGNAPPSMIVLVVLHCTADDLAITSVSLMLALGIAGSAEWPVRRGCAVACVVVVLSVAYTVYSEYLNTIARQSWTYTAAMPTLLGIGLSPLAQWMVVPTLALSWARRRTMIA